jgi:DNA-binding MurR/RpiR family transcriptional regulator
VSPRLAAVLDERFGSLPPKQQAVAHVLAQGPEVISFASVGEIAERAAVDAATVVRTCQRLGYSGWRELQEESRHALSGRPTFADRVEAMGSYSEEAAVEGVRQTALDNVTNTFRDLDLGVLDEIGRAISQADLVVVAADGVSTGAGVFLVSSLQVVGCRAVLATGVGEVGTKLGAARATDLLVAISMWRYLRPTIQALEVASERGLTTIAVTDSRVSPAALLARHCLVAHAASAGPRMGQTGIMALLEVLVAQIALVDPARSIAAAQAADRVYRDGNVLGGPESPAGDRADWARRLDTLHRGDGRRRERA